MRLKQLLFTPQRHRPPLFRSQRDLARKIVSLPHSRYPNLESLVVFLNSVITGGRKCPAELNEALVQVLRTAAAEVQWADAEIRELEDAARRLLRTEANIQWTVEHLLARQLQALSVVVVNSSPLEESRHPLVEEFQDAMLTTIVGNSNVTYKFVIAKGQEIVADTFWQATLDALTKAHSDKRPGFEISEDPAAHLSLLESEGRIRVLAVAPALCLVPLVAFDPDAYNCDLYVWDWWLRDQDVVNQVAALGERVRERWRRDFYSALMLEKMDATRVPFMRKA